METEGRVGHGVLSKNRTHSPKFTSHHTSFTTQTSLVPGSIATAVSSIARVAVSRAAILITIVPPAAATIRLVSSEATRHVGGAAVAVLITPTVTLSALR
jgi:hypothetical protein